MSGHSSAVILSIFLLLSQTAQASNVTQGYVAAYDHDKVTCIYPISGQYAPLQRALYYCLLIFSTIAQKQTWLIAGALAAALTYSGTAAIHALILTGVRFAHTSAVDLDALAVWSILSTGFIAVTTASGTSRVLRESSAHPIFGYWAMLVIAACIILGVSILFGPKHIENACRSMDGALLTSVNQLHGNEVQCSYECFSTGQPLRQPSDLMAMPASRLYGEGTVALLGTSVAATVIFGGSLGLYMWVRLPARRTRPELESDIITFSRPGLGRTPRQKMYARHEVEDSRKELAEGDTFRYANRTWEYLFACLFVVLLVINEVVLSAKGPLPVGESATAIGQWAPWLAVALALLGAAINKHNLPAWTKRQELLAREGQTLSPDND